MSNYQMVALLEDLPPVYDATVAAIFEDGEFATVHNVSPDCGIAPLGAAAGAKALVFPFDNSGNCLVHKELENCGKWQIMQVEYP